jgi:hypothetical protein
MTPAQLCRQHDVGTAVATTIQSVQHGRTRHAHLQQDVATTKRPSTDPQYETAQFPTESPETPMECEAVVGDAMRNLLSGFLILDNLRSTPRPLDEPAARTLGFASQDVAAVLNSLNDCSVGFWRLLNLENRRTFRFRTRFSPDQRASDQASGNGCRHSARAQGHGQSSVQECHESAHLASSKSRWESGSIHSGTGSFPLTDSQDATRRGWVQRLASATLLLVDANAALEALSYSAYPWGAPESFKNACFRLCTALVTLGECLDGTAD